MRWVPCFFFFVSVDCDLKKKNHGWDGQRFDLPFIIRNKLCIILNQDFEWPFNFSSISALINSQLYFRPNHNMDPNQNPQKQSGPVKAWPKLGQSLAKTDLRFPMHPTPFFIPTECFSFGAMLAMWWGHQGAAWGNYYHREGRALADLIVSVSARRI